MTGDTGGVVETSEYKPYGSFRHRTGTSVSDYQFTDQEFDSSSGLYNYDGRLYDPVIGRFISADPFVQDPFNPQFLNRYTYCLNNPLIYVDPSGYFLDDLFDFGGLLNLFGEITGLNDDPVYQGIVGVVQIVGGAIALSEGGDAWNGVTSIGRGLYNVGSAFANSEGPSESSGDQEIINVAPSPNDMLNTDFTDRTPDYYAITIIFPTFKLSGTDIRLGGNIVWEIDYYGRQYFSYLGASTPGGPGKKAFGLSANMGWLDNQGGRPSAEDLERFLLGGSLNISAGYVVGGGYTFVYNKKTGLQKAFEIGIYTPQWGFSGSYSGRK